MKFILKPNQHSGRVNNYQGSRFLGKTVYDMVDICDKKDGVPWGCVSIDAFHIKNAPDWQRDVYDRLFLGEAVEIELSLAAKEKP